MSTVPFDMAEFTTAATVCRRSIRCPTFMICSELEMKASVRSCRMSTNAMLAASAFSAKVWSPAGFCAVAPW